MVSTCAGALTLSFFVFSASCSKPSQGPTADAASAAAAAVAAAAMAVAVTNFLFREPAPNGRDRLEGLEGQTPTRNFESWPIRSRLH